MATAVRVAPRGGDVGFHFGIDLAAVVDAGVGGDEDDLAQRAENARPRADWPAWMITGWPCGERGTVNGPRERKCAPA